MMSGTQTAERERVMSVKVCKNMCVCVCVCVCMQVRKRKREQSYVNHLNNVLYLKFIYFST